MKEMQDYVNELQARYTQIVEVFKDFPVKPTTVPTITKFLEEHVVEIASRYVVLNTFKKPVIPKDEDIVDPRAGMTVASVPAAPKKVDNDEVNLETGEDDGIYFTGDKK